MVSMTGYSFIEEIENNVYTSIEVRSLNNRYLEIYTKLPQSLYPFENKIKILVKNVVKRGKVEVFINLNQLDKEIEISPNINIANKYYDAFNLIIDKLGLDERVRLNHLLRAEELLVLEDKTDKEKIWKIVEQSVIKAIDHLYLVKKQEGDETLKNIQSILEDIEDRIEKIKEFIPKQVIEFEKKIRKKMEELLGNKYDEQRIIMEVGILATRVDINEEMERLINHVKQFKETCDLKEHIGRHLDFISQEMVRELNTIGSKANLIDIINHVVQLKNDVEKIREQIRNVE